VSNANPKVASSTGAPTAGGWLVAPNAKRPQMDDTAEPCHQKDLDIIREQRFPCCSAQCTVKK